MKKKYFASFLSLCLLCNSTGSVTFASETVDSSTASEVVIEEETDQQVEENEDKDFEEDYNDENVDIISKDDIYQEEVGEGDVIIDAGYEENEDNDVVTYSADDNNSLIDLYENNEFTKIENSNIQYKYDKDTKTLEIELIDPNGSTDMPGSYKNTSGTPWYNSLTDEERKELTCIKIGAGITSIGAYSFMTNGSNCYINLNSVELPVSVTSIGDFAFAFGPTGSATSQLESMDLSHVKNIGDGAFQKTGIKKLNLSDVEIGASAFVDCSDLISVKAGKVKLKGSSSFGNCTNLAEFECSELDAIPVSSFSNTTSLKNFKASGIKNIARNAFGLSGIESIALDQKDVTLRSTSFNGSSLKNICYTGTTKDWADKKVSLSNVTIHCNEDEKESLKEATCTESGIGEVVCPVCQNSFTVSVPALGHDWEVKVDQEATCTEAGSESNHCTRCDATDPESAKEIPALGHDWEVKVDREATCTEAGSESNHCTRCDATDPESTKEISALGHIYVSEVTTQPTCVKDGVRTLTCSRCKDAKTEAIPATGVHQWNDWKKTADATVFAPEQQERTCVTCDKKETQTVGNELTATATVNVSSVTLKEKQNTSSVKVTGLANGDSVKSWKSTNTKVFTVTGKADGSCKLAGVKKGSAKLEITMASGLKKTVAVKVQTKTVTTSKISGLTKKMTVQKGAKAALKPVIAPVTSQQKVTYSSSNKKVATVSSKGVITAKKAGTAKITVKSGSKKVTVTVTVPKTKTTAITVGEKVSLKKGKTYSLKAKVTPSNSDEKITYSTSNKKIATVSKSGKIKGVKKGTATITIKSGKVTKKVKVTVK